MRIVNMEEIGTDAFGVYKMWLESGEVEVERVLSLGSDVLSRTETSNPIGNERDIRTGEKGEQELRMAKLELLIESYILGDYIQAPFGFMDRVMSCVVRAFGELYIASEGKLPLEKMRDIWERTYPETPLRDVVVDLLATSFLKSNMKHALVRGELGEDIVREIIDAVRERREENANEGIRARMPWETYHRRYFSYARAGMAREEKKKGKKGKWDGEKELGEVETKTVVAYWDVQGSELKLPEGAKW